MSSFPGSTIKSVVFSSTLLLFFLALSANAYGDQFSNEELYTFNTPRFTLHIGSASEVSDLKPVAAPSLAAHAIEVLDTTYEELSEKLSAAPQRKVTLRFLTPAAFQQLTKAPSWTNAMFFRGEIAIPIDVANPMSEPELTRALKHEYVHAVFAELSGFRCPAWLDEGVAQLFEGKPNPLLGPGLRNWIAENEAMPLDWLENGFTGLNPNIVPAAYAQSLFSAKMLLKLEGYSGIMTYLKKLRLRTDDDVAFEESFHMSKEEFRNLLTAGIRNWAKTDAMHP